MIDMLLKDMKRFYYDCIAIPKKYQSVKPTAEQYLLERKNTKENFIRNKLTNIGIIKIKFNFYETIHYWYLYFEIEEEEYAMLLLLSDNENFSITFNEFVNENIGNSNFIAFEE